MDKFDLIDGVLVGTEIKNFAIVQGATYQVSFRYPSDVSLATPYGQIRTKYAQDVNELLADFSFLPMVYDSLENKTLITAQLTADQTSQIPYTKYQGGDNPSIRNCHVYDMELHFVGGIKKKIVTVGLVQVKPEVTV